MRRHFSNLSWFISVIVATGAFALAGCSDESGAAGTARVVVAVERGGLPFDEVVAVLSYPAAALLSDNACTAAPGFRIVALDEPRHGEVRVVIATDDFDDDEDDEDPGGGGGDGGGSGGGGDGGDDDDNGSDDGLVSAVRARCDWRGRAVLECRFDVGDSVTEEDFAVDVVGATDFTGAAVEPPPAGSIGDVDVFGLEEQSGGGEPRNYELRFGVLNDVGPLGALQFNVEPFAPGGFLGAGGSARCSTLIDGALASFFDTGTELRAGMIDLDGIPTPGEVAACTFRSSQAVTPEHFEIEVIDAANVEGESAACIEMAVTRVDALD